MRWAAALRADAALLLAGAAWLRAGAALLLLAGCTGGGEAARLRANHLAEQAGLRPLVLDAGAFHLMAFLRLSAASPVLRVYIEGDGHAWATSDIPSDDPTPWSPVALELAAADPSPDVAYLARPCQYVPPGTDAACNQSVWTGARYSAAVIASTEAALDRLKALAGASQLELVGFSGGGAVAALAGARRNDLRDLRTVAANLDTGLWTREHDVSPLSGSLDPVAVAPLLAAVPQVHFVGGDDSVVDASVVRAFAAAEGSRRCVTVVTVPNVQHDGNWAALWPILLTHAWPLGCPPRDAAALR